MAKEKQEKKQLTLWERVRADRELFAAWQPLSEEAKSKFIEIDEGIRVPDLLSDTMFKIIFDPERRGEVLSQFLGSILGRKVKVVRQLNNDGKGQSVYSKGIVLDIVVKFEDGSYANVEIQRMGELFSPGRAAVYSGDLLRRQYAVEDLQKKKEVDYDALKPVYTIIIMEHSSDAFVDSTEYVHHFSQKSDTDVKLELLQYYDYICLDIFGKRRPHIAGELERWLRFLSIQYTTEMKTFLEENTSFQPIYDYAILMSKDREELIKMFSEYLANEDVVGSINLTMKSQVKRLTKELEEVRQEKDAELEEKDAELEAMRQEKDTELEEKDKMIASMQEKLRQLEKDK